MSGPQTWTGRMGPVLLGPTESRVATYLAAACRSGWVIFRTSELARRMGLCRSEAYRVLKALRDLGIFGIGGDRGGTHGGRRIWRTATQHEGPRLNATRHLLAVSRIRGWILAGAHHTMRSTRSVPRTVARRVRPAVAFPPAAAGRSPIAEWMRLYGASALLDEWKVTS